MKKVSDLTYQQYCKIYPTWQFQVRDVEEYKQSLYNKDGTFNFEEYDLWMSYTKKYLQENNLI